ncbi:hypothetical protein AVEN_75908-1 [Araneus ventricosus]|uniref:Uncharacterized protein n=1 Tax=Araneus ventricosus TaxID=182803 RepID=A0A4Y2FUH2_ARAVE|nr:hypothetical protein AVEN_75908-1 [Araneus ventricosus]
MKKPPTTKGRSHPDREEIGSSAFAVICFGIYSLSKPTELTIETIFSVFEPKRNHQWLVHAAGKVVYFGMERYPTSLMVENCIFSWTTISSTSHLACDTIDFATYDAGCSQRPFTNLLARLSDHDEKILYNRIRELQVRPLQEGVDWFSNMGLTDINYIYGVGIGNARLTVQSRDRGGHASTTIPDLLPLISTCGENMKSMVCDSSVTSDINIEMKIAY